MRTAARIHDSEVSGLRRPWLVEGEERCILDALRHGESLRPPHFRFSLERFFGSVVERETCGQLVKPGRGGAAFNDMALADGVTSRLASMAPLHESIALFLVRG